MQAEVPLMAQRLWALTPCNLQGSLYNEEDDCRFCIKRQQYRARPECSGRIGRDGVGGTAGGDVSVGGTSVGTGTSVGAGAETNVGETGVGVSGTTDTNATGAVKTKKAKKGATASTSTTGPVGAATGAGATAGDTSGAARGTMDAAGSADTSAMGSASTGAAMGADASGSFTGTGGPAAGTSDYPRCSRTVTDRCMQRGGRRRSTASADRLARRAPGRWPAALSCCPVAIIPSATRAFPAAKPGYKARAPAWWGVAKW